MCAVLTTVWQLSGCTNGVLCSQQFDSCLTVFTMCCIDNSMTAVWLCQQHCVSCLALLRLWCVDNCDNCLTALTMFRVGNSFLPVNCRSKASWRSHLCAQSVVWRASRLQSPCISRDFSRTLWRHTFSLATGKPNFCLPWSCLKH